MPHGIDQDEWDIAIKEITTILVNQAKMKGREIISYSDLYNKITHLLRSSPLIGPEDHRFHRMLGEISTTEQQAGRGMLSVLVVRKKGDMKPGHGFFELTQQLGYKFDDEESFWISEFTKILAAWN